MMVANFRDVTNFRVLFIMYTIFYFFTMIDLMLCRAGNYGNEKLNTFKPHISVCP